MKKIIAMALLALFSMSALISCTDDEEIYQSKKYNIGKDEVKDGDI